MEFDEIPEACRHFLVERDDCWVPASAHRVSSPRQQSGYKRRSLRQVLWEASGREPAPKRRLTPQCGVSKCHRPEHQKPSSLLSSSSPAGWRRLVQQYYNRMGRAQFVNRVELGLAVRSLESRGFTRDARRKGPVRTMCYRVGLGKGRSSKASRENGPWWLYWQEPLRTAGTKAAAQQRRAAA